MFCPLKLG